MACEHYKRNCMLIAPCCEKTFPCRLCHDNEEMHQLNRYKVTEIKCKDCDTIQKVQKQCINCNVIFGAYFCETCRLFDHDISKNQFHCEKCGLCRIGGKENFYHCDKCNMCLSVKLKDQHRCVENASRTNCPVCMEDLHTSTAGALVPKCGHLIHKMCWDGLLESGNYSCPICGESLVDLTDYWKALDEEVERTQMPEEYKETYVHSLCKDCHQVTKTLFHVLGQKCQKCGSYNTCRADEPEEEEEEGAQAIH